MKLEKEVGVLEERIEKTQSEIETFENLDALKDEAEKKRSDLQREKQEFLAVRDDIKEKLKDVKQKYDKIQVSAMQGRKCCVYTGLTFMYLVTEGTTRK